MLIGFAGELVRLSLYRLVHIFDSKPDLTVGPDGTIRAYRPGLAIDG